MNGWMTGLYSLRENPPFSLAQFCPEQSRKARYLLDMCRNHLQSSANSESYDVLKRFFQYPGRFYRFLLFALCLTLFSSVPSAWAHESRPAYLEINETSPGHFSILWRTPVLSGMRLPVVLKFPDDVSNLSDPVVQELADSLLERRVIDAGISGLTGKQIQFVGLQATITDVLVRVQMLDGTYSTTLVRPSQPWVEIEASRGYLAIAGTFLIHGIKHILFGYDHLLFVFALMLIVRSRRVLLMTITAFTISHSITLALATLGAVHLPGPPVEAAIALSILLLAYEIIRLENGHESLTSRWPWAVAFTFGLLHGFGFASALTDIGLPTGDIPLSLFTFNLGVELGQLIFIGSVITILTIVKPSRLASVIGHRALPAATYVTGILAAFWFFERLAGF